MNTTMTAFEDLDDRQKRERDYYNQYAKSYDVANIQVDFAPVRGPLDGVERRPWNSYWAIYESAVDHCHPGARLLDFGSGPGENALRLSKIGYQIDGFDISEENVSISNELFRRHGEKGAFQVSGAEKLPYSSESFDMIVGIDILHHVDIPRAIKECHRVLKKGGKAIFREPVEAPLLDWIRNTKPILKLAPKETSFERHITEDERKLNNEDDLIIRSIFPKTVKKHYSLFSRFDKFYRAGSDPRPSFTEKLDYVLMKYLPFMKSFAGAVIYELEKE